MMELCRYSIYFSRAEEGLLIAKLDHTLFCFGGQVQMHSAKQGLF